MKSVDMSAYAVAVKYLASSERFEREVRKKLEGFDEDEVELVLLDLKKKNILNDRRTAESFCRSRSGRRALGTYGLEQELRRRGASDEIIAEMCASTDEQVTANALLASKFVPDPQFKAKAFRFLASRGFNFEAAHNAVRDFFSEDV